MCRLLLASPKCMTKAQNTSRHTITKVATTRASPPIRIPGQKVTTPASTVTPRASAATRMRSYLECPEGKLLTAEASDEDEEKILERKFGFVMKSAPKAESFEMKVRLNDFYLRLKAYKRQSSTSAHPLSFSNPERQRAAPPTSIMQSMCAYF